MFLASSNDFLHINAIAHEGKLVTFGTAADGRIWYTVKQDGYEGSYLSTPPESRTGWESWTELQLPDEQPDDASVVKKEEEELTYKETGASPKKFLLRSRYRTVDQTAVAPVQLVSGLGHLYVFRQSKTNTLLVDRFVLDGLTNKLTRKLEVRFKRSGMRYEPTGSQKKGEKWLLDTDSLDFRHISGREFYEPTTELCLVENLLNGEFAVVLLPTDEQDRHRWHIFAYDSQLNKVQAVTLLSSDDGLFEVRDDTRFEPAFRVIPGVIRRILEYSNAAFARGLTATRYDIQKEQKTDDGPQLMRESVRVMVAFVTMEGSTAALSFGVAPDGTLSPASQMGDKLRRSVSREVSLSASSLDDIRAVALNSVKGAIEEVARGEGGELTVKLSGSGVDALDGKTIQVSDSKSYNQIYSAVTPIDANTFELSLPPQGEVIGAWESLPSEQAISYDGMITAYRKMPSGKLRITAPGHRLAAGDAVQIVDTRDYNGTYTVTRAADGTLTLDGASWQGGAAISMTKMRDTRRRGMVFDGVDDHVQLPPMDRISGQGFTFEAWVRYESFKKSSRIVEFGNGAGQANVILGNHTTTDTLWLAITLYGKTLELQAPKALKLQQWMHVAATVGTNYTSKLYVNGVEVASKILQPAEWVQRKQNYIGRSSSAQDGYFHGQIADVRVWTKVRSADEIRNSMHADLTGQEDGLIGYWKLNGLVTLPRPTTPDFSVQGNDGLVMGGAYITGKRLPRALSDGATKADMFVNEDLFAVTQRGTYTEELEFKLTPGKDPNNIDNQGKIFSLVWSGTRGVSSRERTKIPAAAGTTFKKLNNDGWHLASATFNVPDGLSMVRMFGIEQVKGDWTEIEIRNRRITYVSETITERVCTQPGILAVKPDALAGNRAGLEDFTSIELRIAQLQYEKADLDRRIKLLQVDSTTSINNMQHVVNITSEKVAALTKERDACKAQYDRWKDVEVTLYKHVSFQGEARGLKLGAHVLPKDWQNTVSSLRVPPGLHVFLFQAEDFTLSRAALSDEAYVGHLWNERIKAVKVVPIGGGDLDWFLREYQEKEAALISALAELSRWTAELNDMKNGAQNRLAKLQELMSRMTVVDADLEKLRGALSGSKTALLSKLSAVQPVGMNGLGTINGLTTQGALLEFIRPTGRLQALETCDGNVQLSYFDNLGCMRQTIFDATSDAANACFEQWVPDQPRFCLSFTGSSHVLSLDNPVELGEEWSIELWFLYPFSVVPQTLVGGMYKRTLVGGGAGAAEENHLTVCCTDSAEKLCLLVNTKGSSKLVDSQFDMKTLRPGWHHLAAVASGTGDKAETRFYVDGKSPDVPGSSKGCVVAAKTTARVARIGNSANGSEPFGKLAEVRVWSVALTPEEVLAHSLTTLTGNEPALLAYLPMSEGSGNRLADKSGNGRAGTLSDGSIWWPCLAPIGNPGSSVMTFDGLDDYVELPASMNVNLSQGMTLEAWVRYASFNKRSRVIELANDAGLANIFLANVGRTDELFLGVVAAGGQSEVSAPQVLKLNQWMHLAATMAADGTAKLYVNGKEVASKKLPPPENIQRRRGCIGRSSSGVDGYFQGEMAEVRVWAKARSGDEIRAAMHRRGLRNGPGLVACWSGQELTADGKIGEIVAGAHGTRISHVALISSNTAPISGDAVVSAEYSTISVNAKTAQRTAMMRRFFGTSGSFGAHMLTGKRVEEVELRWIGNGQFAPTLLGYVEGPPPVPSENLTIEDNYNGATSVELTTSEDVQYSWRRSQDAGLGVSLGLFLGTDFELELLTAPLGIGTQQDLLHVRAGFKGDLTLDYRFQNESSVAASSSNHLTDRLELRGAREQDARFPQVGRRFIPKNVGYALVISALADVFISRLTRTKRMIGYQVLPVEGVPPDINTITFLINPAYTMNGSLDGLTGGRATSQRFFKHVPAMRTHYGSLYPASYYRLQEAYELKEWIEKEDKRRQAYFSQFNTLLVDEISLARETSGGAGPGPVVVNPPDAPKPASGSKPADQEAAQKDALNDAEGAYDSNSAAVKKRNAEIQAKIDDMNARAHASACFAGWQTKMENILIRAGKRNIVNTYVWDADGGLRTEEQSFASIAEHTIGGSFALNAALGAELGVNIAGAQVDLTAQATVSMTQTMSKTEARARGMELKVDLSGVESRGITDYNDLPLQPGEKVGRYRFMSFYLEGSTENFHDFFGYVVDPEWLAGNSEEARALRMARGKANKAWRVLHRVTYVERPALAGVGRDLRAFSDGSAQADDEASIVGLFDRLAQLQKTLDDVLKKLGG